MASATLSVRTKSRLYEPLPERGIRVLQIHPDPTAPHGFELKLTACPFDEAPPYACVSHTWKTALVPEPSSDVKDEDPVFVTVKCDGQDLEIPENLLDFLLRASNARWFAPIEEGQQPEFPAVTDAKGNPRPINDPVPAYLWAAGVCIDQQDLDERSRQVSMMGDIFSGCRATLVWLGKDAPGTGPEGVLTDFAPKLMDRAVKHGIESLRNRDPFCHDADLIEDFGEKTCIRWRDCWKDLIVFFSRQRWFRRGWVVQEVVLKSVDKVEEVIVICGSFIMPWNILCKFFFLLGTSDWRKELSVQLRADPRAKNNENWSNWSISVIKEIMGLRNVEYIVESFYMGQTPVPLRIKYGITKPIERVPVVWFKIMSYLAEREFSDEKDRGFAYLGLINKILHPKHQGPVSISANYHLSIRQLRINEYWFVIERMPYLDALSTAGEAHRRGRQEIPSWVPDLTTRFGGIKLQTMRDSFKCSPLYNASFCKSPGGEEFSLGDAGQLTLRGIRMASATVLGPMMMDRATTELDVLSLMTRLPDTHRNTDEPQALALLRTLIADCFPGAVENSDRTSTAKAWLITRLRNRRRYLVKTQNKRTLARFDEVLTKLSARSAWSDFAVVVRPQGKGKGPAQASQPGPLENVVYRLWIMRRFFISDRGHFALGPSCCEENDEVWILKGGRVPFILRKQKDQSYKLIGEAYVHGMMYGDAMSPELLAQMKPVIIT